MFLDNPSVLYVNIFLSCIGFKDANVFNRYYNNAVLITFLENYLSCNPKLPQAIFLFGENKNMYALHKWYENASKNKSDTVCANHLIEPMLNGQTSNDTMKDAFSMYVDNFNHLPEPLKKRILKDGFTEDVHNRMCEALGRAATRYGSRCKKNKEDVKYSEDELKLEYKITKMIKDEKTGEEKEKVLYLFELPKNTDDLYLISEKMHNCVGYAYRSAVLEKKCLIMTLEDKTIHKGVACIEIVSQQGGRFDNICQALGPCNNRIEKKYIPIIQRWMKLYRLTTTVNDLKEERNLD